MQGSIRTKTVHSEILWALNPTNNVTIFHPFGSVVLTIWQITEAIRRYGVADTTTALIVVRICSPNLQDIEQRMSVVVSGMLSPLETLADITDWASVKKVCRVCGQSGMRPGTEAILQYHKLNGEPALKAVAKDPARERVMVEEIVTSSVAMKSVMG